LEDGAIKLNCYLKRRRVLFTKKGRRDLIWGLPTKKSHERKRGGKPMGRKLVWSGAGGKKTKEKPAETMNSRSE